MLKYNKLRLLSIILYFIMMFFCFSCSVPYHKFKLYEGPQLPPDKVAFLINESRPIILVAVDDLKGSGEKDFDRKCEIELLPGDHIIVIDYLLNTSRNVSGMAYVYQEFYRYSSPRLVKFSFKAESGHTYRLVSIHDLNQLKWEANIIDMGSNERLVESEPYSLQKIRTGDNKFEKHQEWLNRIIDRSLPRLK